jgi:hypothetical protein
MVRRVIAVLVAVAVLVVLAIVIFGGDDSSESSAGEPVALSESELREESGNLGHVTYWLGPKPGTTSYELTATPDGRNYIRYLTGGAEAGNPLPNYLTVGTYSLPNARQALRKATNGDSSKLTKHNGYELLKGSSTDVYVVFKDQPDLQIEIFDPTPGEAAKLAKSGALVPLG